MGLSVGAKAPRKHTRRGVRVRVRIGVRLQVGVQEDKRKEKGERLRVLKGIGGLRIYACAFLGVQRLR